MRSMFHVGKPAAVTARETSACAMVPSVDDRGRRARPVGSTARRSSSGSLPRPGRREVVRGSRPRGCTRPSLRRHRSSESRPGSATAARRRGATACPHRRTPRWQRAGRRHGPSRSLDDRRDVLLHQVIAVGVRGEGAVVTAVRAERHVHVDPEGLRESIVIVEARYRAVVTEARAAASSASRAAACRSAPRSTQSAIGHDLAGPGRRLFA